MMHDVVTKAITASTWPDFVALMQTDAQCSDCWCLNHRVKHGCATGAAAKLDMEKRVVAKNVHGILAYDGSESIGWVAVDPMSELLGHDKHESGKAGEWSIHCLFVKEEYRGQGLSAKLLRAAIDYAKDGGAKLISAFPIPSENLNKFPSGEAEFSGRYSSFVKLGFSAVGEPSSFYQRMELVL